MAVAEDDIIRPDWEEKKTGSEITHPVPRTAQGFLDIRKLKAKRSLNEQVEEYHLKVINNAAIADTATGQTIGDKYASYLDAVYDSQAIEGSLLADNIFAADMLRAQARKDENNELGRQNVATIAKALNVVLRRYGMGRKERRYTVGGTVVTPNHDTDE